MKWICIFIISILFACSSDNKKLHEEKMNVLQNLILGLDKYNTPIDDFKEVKGRFPDSLYEVYLAYKHDNPEEIGYIELYHFMDIFNKKGRWIGYFPIYNSDDSQIISYLLLSAGIDGKLDNVNNPSNKLHLDDWKQKLKLYNPDEFDDGVNIFSNDFDGDSVPCTKIDIEHPYSTREEKLGNKDLLLHVNHMWCKTEQY